jgi:serine protease Do
MTKCGISQASVTTAALLSLALVELRLDVAPRVLAQSASAATNGPVLHAETFREIAKALMPSVVNVRTESRSQTGDLSRFFGDDPFGQFFGPPRQPAPAERVTQGAGSGFIIADDGTILTNNHVVAGATKITVALYADERGIEYDARIVGRDPLTDSALIELTEKPGRALPAARLGHSRTVNPGDWVMAIGNPFNLSHTVTVGVVSAIGRPFPVSEGRWQNLLQTDAAINPGNSGGPLLNLNGEVIGINSAIMTSRLSPGNVGVGFAIPIDAIRALLPELRTGRITRGRIGVQITPVTEDLVTPLGLPDADGALVRQVERDGPADAAGIEPGDVIVRYGSDAVEHPDRLVSMVTRTKPGTHVPVEVVRDGQRQTRLVTIASLDLTEGGAGTETPSDTGFGMSLRGLTPEIRAKLQVPSARPAVVVATVESGGAAARAGVRAGDVLLEINGMNVQGPAHAAAAMRRLPPDGAALVLLWRQRQELFVTITR